MRFMCFQSSEKLSEVNAATSKESSRSLPLWHSFCCAEQQTPCSELWASVAFWLILPHLCSMLHSSIWQSMVTMQNIHALQHVCKSGLWTWVSGRHKIYPAEVKKSNLGKRNMEEQWNSLVQLPLQKNLTVITPSWWSQRRGPLEWAEVCPPALVQGRQYGGKLLFLKCTAALLLCLAEASGREEQELIMQVKKGTVQIGTWAGNALET